VNMIQYLIDLILYLVHVVVTFVVIYSREHPVTVFLALLAFIRTFGTTVQTGWAGVLFSFGRAKKVLEPGFHPLIPIFQRVRQTPIRSVTLNLPVQRVTTGDGLVYEVDSTLVYRVEDPILALTGIDDVKKGCLTIMPLLVHDLMREHTRENLSARAELDAELMARARKALSRWGLAVEQAGLSSIAPTAHTALLTQLPARIAERARLLDAFAEQEVGRSLSIALIAPGAVPMSRARARARERARRRLLHVGHAAMHLDGALPPASGEAAPA
jgi:regulator of protease activity HflC (stomatin/prohibitin superfamily)